MLSSNVGDRTDDENHFMAAYFAYRKANESSTNINNVMDVSAKSILARTELDSLLPLRQQMLLIHGGLGKDPDASSLEMFNSLTREYAIASSKLVSLETRIDDAPAKLATLFSTISTVEKESMDDYVNDLNARLEGLLKPPKQHSPSNSHADVQPPKQNETKPSPSSSAFVTAKSMMPSGSLGSKPASNNNLGNTPRSLGVNKRPRVNPATAKNNQDLEDISSNYGYYNQKPNTNNNTKAPPKEPEEPVDERLAGIDAKLVEMIKNEIQHGVDHISWDDIAGLDHAKNTIKEIVIWPMLRPDIFKGLRGPPKGLLLFGPPGTGKTMIGKCIASQAKATFFSISASSLTSKWVGEGEKLVRALFAVARCSQPSVIFIDEIDSLLTQRTDGEFEASRRIKTEFLVQFDGASTSSEDRILVIGATNRPQEIDEAARRRLVKRLYIPLPDGPARIQIVRNLLGGQCHEVSDSDLDVICTRTDGYSGSDMDNLCREAALGPIRSITDIMNIDQDAVRPINLDDFEKALSQVRASVSKADLASYLDWNSQFGSIG